jgi:hypothetical protein
MANNIDKYYVWSKDLKIVQEASSPKKACYFALQRFDNHLKLDGESIDPLFFYVDQRGFREPPREQDGSLLCLSNEDLHPKWVINTEEILAMFGGD